MTAAGYVATVFSIVSALIATGSLLVALRSVDMARQLNRETRDARYVAAITTCNQRYLDWRRNGLEFENEDWCYGIWDLVATEFNFFREGWLPPFMFRFWMNTLSAWYQEYPNAWPSHQRFLDDYSGSRTDMEGFFQNLYKISSGNKSVEKRNREVEVYVNNWINKKTDVLAENMNVSDTGLLRFGRGLFSLSPRRPDLADNRAQAGMICSFAAKLFRGPASADIPALARPHMTTKTELVIAATVREIQGSVKAHGDATLSIRQIWASVGGLLRRSRIQIAWFSVAWAASSATRCPSRSNPSRGRQSDYGTFLTVTDLAGDSAGPCCGRLP